MKPRRCPHCHGFTLIEMIITLCVFLLLAGAIFSIFGATLESASTLQDNQNREDSAQALESWLRHSFQALPADGVLISYHRDSQALPVSGVIWGAGADLRALDLQRQPNGNDLLRMANYQPDKDDSSLRSGDALKSAELTKFQEQVLSEDPALAWRPLMRDIKSMGWRFRKQSGGNWADTSVAGKPLVAELVFQAAGVKAAIVNDFWIPPLQPPGDPALPAAAPAVSVNP